MIRNIRCNDEKYHAIPTKRMDPAVLTVTDSRDLPGPTWQIDHQLQDLPSNQSVFFVLFLFVGF